MTNPPHKKKLIQTHDTPKPASSLARAQKNRRQAAKRAGKPTEALASRAAKKREQIRKATVAAKVKEDLKTVALGTSKINYMDPRISVAWCKRNEVPIEKVFNKSLIAKFHWAMDVDWEFRF